VRACVCVFVGVRGWGRIAFRLHRKVLTVLLSICTLHCYAYTRYSVILATALQSNMSGCCAVASIPRKFVVCVV
jgi:hypothetical protein